MKQKQHLIPKVYLDSFLDSGKKLYSIKTKSSDKTKFSDKQTVQQSSAAGVGYKENYYDTSKMSDYFYKDLGSNHIENEINAFYENSYKNLLNTIIEKPSEVSLDFAKQFIELLISFKQRNPEFNSMMDKETRLRVAKEKVDIAIESGFYEKVKHHLNGESKEEFYARVYEQMEEFVSDEFLPKKVQMEAIVDLRKGQNGFADEVMQILIAGEWFIFESTHLVPFITSDNPGYTFDTEERVQNLSFDSAVSFQFPLTPSLLFMVMIPMKSPFINNKKRINYNPCSPELTRLFNKALIPYSHSRLISNDKNEMQYMLDTYFTPKVK